MIKIRQNKEDYNKLLKIKVNFVGDENQGSYQLIPINDRNGKILHMKSFLFAGSMEEFRQQVLMPLQASDDKKDPPSKRYSTYKHICTEIIQGNDNIIWCFSSNWSKLIGEKKVFI